MNNILKLEEATMFAAGIFAFTYLDLSWWWFIGFLLVPDIGMIGYLHNNKTGAFLYNLFHHKGIAVLIGLAGLYVSHHWLVFAGIILFSHASMDRMLGYGLKYETGFKFTHLGEIGK